MKKHLFCFIKVLEQQLPILSIRLLLRKKVMSKQTKRMPVRYKTVSGNSSSDFKWERSLDLIFSPGCFTVEIDHTDENIGLPLEFCSSEHYIVGTLVVTDSGTNGAIQENRVRGQILMFTARKNKETQIYVRTFADGEWGMWKSFMQMGAYNEIATTEELVASVRKLLSDFDILQNSITNHQRLLEINNNPLGLSTTFGIEEFIAVYLQDGEPHKIGIRQITKDSGCVAIYDATMGKAITVEPGVAGSNPTGVKEYWASRGVNKTVDGVEKSFYAVYYIRINWDIVKEVPWIKDVTQITEFFTLQPAVPVALSVAGSSLLNMLQSLDYDITKVKEYNSDGIAKKLSVVWRDDTPGTVTYSDYRADVLEYGTLAVTYDKNADAEKNHVKVVQVREYSEMGDVIKRTTTIKYKYA